MILNHRLYKIFVNLEPTKHLSFFSLLFRIKLYSFIVFFVASVGDKVELVMFLAMLTKILIGL